jgi:hypothetical protein
MTRFHKGLKLDPWVLERICLAQRFQLLGQRTLIGKIAAHAICLGLICKLCACMWNSYGDLLSGVRGLHVYDDLQSFSASDNCPIDQQTSAEWGFPHIRLLSNQTTSFWWLQGRKSR